MSQLEGIGVNAPVNGINGSGIDDGGRSAFLFAREESRYRFREMFTRKSADLRCRWLDDDKSWNEVLSCKVDAKFLNRFFHSLSTEQLRYGTTPRNRAVGVNMNQKPIIHRLLHRLVGSLSLLQLADQLSSNEVIKGVRALEILGVVLSQILFRTFVDFTQDIFSLLCDLNDAEVFLNKLISSLLIPIQNFPSDAHVGDYQRRLALDILIIISSACDHIQQNTLMDNFASLHAELWAALVAVFDDSGTDIACKESSLLMTGLLCNFRKREMRNPFIEGSLRKASVYDTHACIFALDSLLNQSINGLQTEIKSNSASLSNLFAMAEDATSSFLNWGIGLTTSVGAWVAGVQEEPKDSNNIKPLRLRRSSKSFAYELGGVVPVIIRGSNDSSEIDERELSMDNWIQVRTGLLSLYELLCSSGGKNWMEESLLHEVPPWASSDTGRGSRPQPVACPSLFLRSLSFLSFFMYSGNPPATLIALNIMRCFTENEMASSLLFTSTLENYAEVNAIEVFERVEGKIRYSASVKKPKLSDRLSFSQDEINPKKTLTQSQSNSNIQHQSLAAVCYHMMANVLLENTSELELEQDAVSHNPDAYVRTVGKHNQPGHICVKSLEVIHRLLVFEARMLSAEEIERLGTRWQSVWKALFVCAKTLCREDALQDLDDRERFRAISSLIHILNMSLRGRSQQELSHYYYEVVRYRSMFEDLRKMLENNRSFVSLGGERISKIEMANIRTIVFHFSSVISVTQNASENMSQAIIMKTIEQHAANLSLKTVDRMGDAYREYVETKDEISIQVCFLRHLVADIKKCKLFYKLVKHTPKVST